MTDDDGWIDVPVTLRIRAEALTEGGVGRNEPSNPKELVEFIDLLANGHFGGLVEVDLREETPDDHPCGDEE